MKILLKWSPLRRFIRYLQERFTFLVLLCWPAIIWVACRVCVWAVDSAMLLMGKPVSESFTVYLQPLMTFSALVRISLSWVVLLLSCSAWRWVLPGCYVACKPQALTSSLIAGGRHLTYGHRASLMPLCQSFYENVAVQ